MPQTWFVSSNKLDYERTKEAERRQNELQENEIRAMRADQNARLQIYDQSINEASSRIKKLKEQNNEEVSNKEREIVEEKMEHAEKLKKLDESFQAKKLEMGTESKEKLRELQAANKIEKDQLAGAHKEALALKKQELTDLKIAHKNAVNTIELEQKKIYQERKDQIARNDAEVDAVRVKHRKEISTELDLEAKIKQEVAERQRAAIKAETAKQVQHCESLLNQQINNMHANMSRDVADGIIYLMNPFVSSVEAVKQLKDNCLYVKDDQSSMLCVQNSNLEWSGHRYSTGKAVTNTKLMLNNYSGMDPKFRQHIADITNDIDRSMSKASSVEIDLNRALEREDVNTLLGFVPKLEEHIQVLEGLHEKLRIVCSPKDNTMQSINGTPQQRIEGNHEEGPQN